MATHPVFLLGKSHGQRSLVGYSPYGHKESNTTKHVCAHAYTHTHTQTHYVKTIRLCRITGE